MAINVKITSSTEGLDQGLQKAKQSAHKTLNDISKHAENTSKGFNGILQSLKSFGPVGMAAAAGVGLIVTAAIKAWNWVKNTASSMDQLAKTAKSLNMTTSEYQAMTYAARHAGLEFEEVNKIIVKINDNLAKAGDGSEKALRAFHSLGVSVKYLNSLSEQGKLTVLLEKMQGLDDTTKRKVAFDLFGAKGYQSINKFNNSEFLNDMRNAQSYGFVYSDEVLRAAEQLVDSQGDASMKIQKAIVEMTNLEKAFETFSKIIVNREKDTKTAAWTELTPAQKKTDIAFEEAYANANPKHLSASERVERIQKLMGEVDENGGPDGRSYFTNQIATNEILALFDDTRYQFEGPLKSYNGYVNLRIKELASPGSLTADEKFNMRSFEDEFIRTDFVNFGSNTTKYYQSDKKITPKLRKVRGGKYFDSEDFSRILLALMHEEMTDASLTDTPDYRWGSVHSVILNRVKSRGQADLTPDQIMDELADAQISQILSGKKNFDERELLRKGYSQSQINRIRKESMALTGNELTYNEEFKKYDDEVKLDAYLKDIDTHREVMINLLYDNMSKLDKSDEKYEKKFARYAQKIASLQLTRQVKFTDYFKNLQKKFPNISPEFARTAYSNFLRSDFYEGVDDTTFVDDLIDGTAGLLSRVDSIVEQNRDNFGEEALVGLSKKMIYDTIADPDSMPETDIFDKKVIESFTSISDLKDYLKQILENLHALKDSAPETTKIGEMMLKANQIWLDQTTKNFSESAKATQKAAELDANRARNFEFVDSENPFSPIANRNNFDLFEYLLKTPAELAKFYSLSDEQQKEYRDSFYKNREAQKDAEIGTMENELFLAERRKKLGDKDFWLEQEMMKIRDAKGIENWFGLGKEEQHYRDVLSDYYDMQHPTTERRDQSIITNSLTSQGGWSSGGLIINSGRHTYEQKVITGVKNAVSELRVIATNTKEPTFDVE